MKHLMILICLFSLVACGTTKPVEEETVGGNCNVVDEVCETLAHCYMTKPTKTMDAFCAPAAPTGAP